jgi:hypothetical protein
MKTGSSIKLGIAAAATIFLVGATSSMAGGSYGFGFSYHSGGGHHGHYRHGYYGSSYGFSYTYRSPRYYYYDGPRYYCPPPVVYRYNYCPPPVYYYPPAGCYPRY